MATSAYRVLMHHLSHARAEKYLSDLKDATVKPGEYLKKALAGNVTRSTADFLELLVNTKHPRIFAESEISGDGSDWNKMELFILGDISIAVPVTIYDNGLHRSPQVHSTPLSGTLLFTPGALLQGGAVGTTPVDWDDVTSGDNQGLNYEGYFSLYERRLLPPLLYADSISKSNNKKAFITVPGLGCGQFAGPFNGKLGEHLKKVLIDILTKHKNQLLNIRGVYYDPYMECENERHEIGSISFLVRPLTKGNSKKSQLCDLQTYEDKPTDDFRSCQFFSFVAWDHVSWPGNDYFAGMRATDDGVKAAATNSMEVITGGITGAYNNKKYRYDAPAPFTTWQEVVFKNNLMIEVKNNLSVLPAAGAAAQ